MNEDPKKNNDQDGNKPVWLSLVYPILAVLAFVGTGVGGMFHYLNAGEGSPEYQLFVLRVSGFILSVFFFFLLLLAIPLIASEAGKAERETGRKLVKVLIRGLGIVFFGIVGLSAWAVLETGKKTIGMGIKEYVESIQAEIDADKSLDRTNPE